MSKPRKMLGSRSCGLMHSFHRLPNLPSSIAFRQNRVYFGEDKVTQRLRKVYFDTYARYFYLRKCTVYHLTHAKGYGILRECYA